MTIIAPRTRTRTPLCVAPIADLPYPCGLPATAERTVEGLVCALCAQHSAELDQDGARPGDEGAAVVSARHPHTTMIRVRRPATTPDLHLARARFAADLGDEGERQRETWRAELLAETPEEMRAVERVRARKGRRS